MVEPITNDFNAEMDYWIDQLNDYTPEQFELKPSATEWSVGQMYQHLLEATVYFFKNTRECIQSDTNKHEQLTLKGQGFFEMGALPAVRIEGPPTNKLTQQPESIEYIREKLSSLKEKVNTIFHDLHHNNKGGKKQHFDLGFFAADQWMLFMYLHLHHHRLQEARLREWLKLN